MLCLFSVMILEVFLFAFHTVCRHAQTIFFCRSFIFMPFDFSQPKYIPFFVVGVGVVVVVVVVVVVPTTWSVKNIIYGNTDSSQV